MFGCLAEQGMFDVLSLVSWIRWEGIVQKFQNCFLMGTGLMNNLKHIGKVYRNTLAILAPSMEQYGTELPSILFPVHKKTSSYSWAE